MMPKTKQQFAAMILAGLFCFSLLSCSKQDKTQARNNAAEQKSLAESPGESVRGNPKQAPNTDTSLSPTERDALAGAFAPIPGSFGFIHKDSIKHNSRTFAGEVYFKDRYSDIAQADFAMDFGNWVYHEIFLNLPDRRLVFTKHWNYGAIDTPTGIVMFWETRGDSLQFIPLKEKSYLSFYGEPEIADSMRYAGGALVLVLHGGSGDAGDVWGYYDVLRFQKHKPIEHLAHESYEYTDAFDIEVDSTEPNYTTLKCEIIREEKSAVKIRYIHDALADMRDGNDRLVKSDTTYAAFR